MNIKYLKMKEKRVLENPNALYTTDVMFQQANSLCRKLMKAGSYFSAKHNLQGVITEASVPPMGICICLSMLWKGVNSDISIFWIRRSRRVQLCRKSDEDDDASDIKED